MNDHRTRKGLTRKDVCFHPQQTRCLGNRLAAIRRGAFRHLPARADRAVHTGRVPKGGTVLDPFAGAGTTGLVADRLGRNAILIELNPDYAAMTERRITDDAGMFAEFQQEAP